VTYTQPSDAVDPKRARLSVQKLPILGELAYALYVGS